MKIFKSGPVVHSVAFLVLILAATGCSLISVSEIRNASRNDVVNLGDSIFALSGKIHDNLQSWAGETFRRYSLSGSMVSHIADQYAKAKRDNPNIQTIFMDGGGNDILIPATLFDPYNCKVDWWESGLSSRCKSLIDDVYVDTVNLLNQMGRDGVDNIIFLGYYRLKNGIIGSTSLNQAVDYGDARLAQAVQNAVAAPNYRVFVDPRSSIVSSDITWDGVHPNDSGSYKLAALIWARLQPLL
ncbi:MAG: GDSL-like Lipase/Acylhydrolase [Deltaproteobacteria bacterium ADurb.BinA179]|jgi:lysophospholipase L1-like esterase|nr:SGNH/GDSL hydrolase family protein [Pseudomonadota bacterium]OPZ27832.1 MAG: GDSL-like Lipase/Acylhydrolase [Deltaproteobacteria bacterium ADurb.BinA179]HNR50039.1 SGNH/GDSL hydrolase family protein [Deltaproteobacteria bacterium]HRR22381.1 SGNH/GDSL hydrolase family protein [Desulfomonilia bacterium]HNU73539.1 SGNH/GDSL hydrolase family protein [Deltaproteobacteria bacterium]